jgi:hypothetical protein
MHRTLIALLAALAIQAGSVAGAAPPPAAPGYSHAVARICAGAVLFSRSHRTGTRAGAIAVSRDIRSTGDHRLARVDALAKPPLRARLAARWIAIERRLVATYAWAYLRIWYAIERANTPAQRARLPKALAPLISAPDALQRKAKRLEQRLRVPDCTGGIQPPPAAGDLGYAPGQGA